MKDNPIRVFVAHHFQRSADYQRVFEYLESVRNFAYLNTADPDVAPAGGEEGLREELRRQIQAAEVLVLPVTTYESDRQLATFQMDVAGSFAKPIIAIRSFGETVVLQKALLDRAAELVEWNDRSIADAIRRQARHEDTARWEVIEFKLD